MIGKQPGGVCGLKLTEWCCKHRPCLFVSAGQVYSWNHHLCMTCRRPARPNILNACMAPCFWIGYWYVSKQIAASWWSRTFHASCSIGASECIQCFNIMHYIVSCIGGVLSVYKITTHRPSVSTITCLTQRAINKMCRCTSAIMLFLSCL